MFGNPDIAVRFVFPCENNKETKNKNKKPFIVKGLAILKIEYNNEIFIVVNQANYCYDGATIPFNIGKGNMKLLIPSLFHDIICENKKLVNYNRKISSLVFKELLIQCNVNKIIAWILYFTVDNFQKFQKGWL